MKKTLVLLSGCAALALCMQQETREAGVVLRLGNYLSMLKSSLLEKIRGVGGLKVDRSEWYGKYKELTEKAKEARRHAGRYIAEEGKKAYQNLSEKSLALKEKISEKLQKAKEAAETLNKEEAPEEKKEEEKKEEMTEEELEQNLEELRKILMKALAEYQQHHQGDVPPVPSEEEKEALQEAPIDVTTEHEAPANVATEHGRDELPRAEVKEDL